MAKEPGKRTAGSGGLEEKWKKDIVEGNVVKTKGYVCDSLLSLCVSSPLIDPMEEVLVIEVWDSDETAVGVTKVKGLKGIGK